MEQYKQEFIEFMVESQVLKFGEFTLKRHSSTAPEESRHRFIRLKTKKTAEKPAVILDGKDRCRLFLLSAQIKIVILRNV